MLGAAEKGGGSVHQNLHTSSLLQKARERTNLPIVAQGGIVEGRGMATAFALGAEGVLMGTRFIESDECPWHDNYKRETVDARKTMYLNPGSEGPLGGMEFQAVRTPYSEEVERGERGDWRSPYAGDHMKSFYGGRTDQALVGGGESAVLIGSVKSAGDIIRDTVEEFWREIDRLSDLRRMARPIAA